MTLATAIFPQEPTSVGKGQTLPHHLWPNSNKHDVLAICKRTKVLRRLAVVMTSAPITEASDPSHMESPHHHLWTRVIKPLILRNTTSPTIRNQ